MTKGRWFPVTYDRTSIDWPAVEQPENVNPAEYSLHMAQPMINNLSIVSIIFGIAAIVSEILIWPPILAIPAIICGHLARKKITLTNERGRDLATTGMALGYVSFAIGLVMWLLIATVGSITFG